MCVFCISVTQIDADTMSGATYTLNGGISSMSNQGESATHTLQSVEHSSGGTYTLYPSGNNPEVSDASHTTSGTGGAYGGESGTSFVPGTLYPEEHNTESNTHTGESLNTLESKQLHTANFPTYTTYFYDTLFHFGTTSTATTSLGDTRVSPKINWSLAMVILVGLCLIAIRILITRYLYKKK